MLAKKYIITADKDLIMGEVELHENLIENNKKIIGGGRWRNDYDNENVIRFYGKSDVYGAVSKEELQEAILKDIAPQIINGKKLYFSKEEYMSDAIRLGFSELINKNI